MATRKKAFVKTYGCQMNVYDSGRMADALEDAGYSPTDSAESADLVVINTCHIREKATEKLYSELGRMKGLKHINPRLQIAVAGCVAQAEGQEIIRRQPAVDIVVGPQAYHNLPSLVDQTKRKKPTVEIRLSEVNKFASLPVNRGRGPTAFVTVQEGCDKFCTFCVVPYTRGAEVSRPADKILEEARQLADSGVREITLLGQNVNAYKDAEACTLAMLVRRLARIDGIERLRFTTSHPCDMSDDLIAAFDDCPQLMPYLHLPPQSGSDQVLRSMNRGYTANEYIRLVEKIRQVRPDILISGDFIVGFPGECETDFEATMALVREVEFGQFYAFGYSARPGTPAAEREQVEKQVVSERLQRLQALLRHQQHVVQSRMIGRQISILLDRLGRKKDQIGGKSEHMHMVHLNSEGLKLGDIVFAQVTGSGANSLNARIIRKAA